MYLTYNTVLVVIISLLFLKKVSTYYRSLSIHVKYPNPNILKLPAKISNNEIFYCTECGVEHIKWVGRCTACREWNTVKEMKFNKNMLPLDNRINIKLQNTLSTSSIGSSSSWLPTTDLSGEILAMNSIDVDKATKRLVLFSDEVNRVLGGGLVNGSTILLAGEPGIGKSTLLMQLANNIASEGYGQVIYISGEENAQQIVSRANRLKLNTDNIFLICDVDTDLAIQQITTSTARSQIPPALIIVDSVQTLRSSTSSGAMGSVSQIRDSTAQFVQLAKLTGSVVLLAGHVTKSGEVAGPRILEHMVDTEGNERSEHRLLRSIKNRFGSTSEVGVFAMTEEGLMDVSNPSELFLSPLDNDSDSEGSDGENMREGACVAVLMEGSRPLLAEIQSLVNNHPILPASTTGGNRNIPSKRAADGFPIQRLLLICAVIEKRLLISLWSKDIYLNVVGGLRVSEPSADLAVAMSIISSCLEEPIIAKTAFIGEIGLGGELRGGKRLEDRIKEALKMGFVRIIVPKLTNSRSSSSSSRSSNKAFRTITTTSPATTATSTADEKLLDHKYIYKCSNLFQVVELSFMNKDIVNELINKKKKRMKTITSTYNKYQPTTTTTTTTTSNNNNYSNNNDNADNNPYTTDDNADDENNHNIDDFDNNTY